MTIGQLSDLRRWHGQHRPLHPVESECWNLMLTLWVLGVVGLPVSLLLGSPTEASGSLAAMAAPSVYFDLRTYLHRKQRLRCDWLHAGPVRRRQRQS